MTPWKTRIAPSPTGHLHLGHALHFSYVKQIAQKYEAQTFLRMEDHDQSRCRPEYVQSILEDLLWLEFIPSIPTQENLWTQSRRATVYQGYFEKLMKQHLLYACDCSRKDVQSLTGQGEGELCYPGTCRNKNLSFDAPHTCIRLKMPDQEFLVSDHFKGELLQNPSHQCGDMVIRDRHSQWTYQFCVVIDDLEQDINLIVRGEDLLASCGRQLALRFMLAPQSKTPLFFHHPLIQDPMGNKLSKRNHSESLSSLRKRGASKEEVLSMIASYLSPLNTPKKPALST